MTQAAAETPRLSLCGALVAVVTNAQDARVWGCKGTKNRKKTQDMLMECV